MNKLFESQVRFLGFRIDQSVQCLWLRQPQMEFNCNTHNLIDSHKTTAQLKRVWTINEWIFYSRNYLKSCGSRRFQKIIKNQSKAFLILKIEI